MQLQMCCEIVLEGGIEAAIRFGELKMRAG